MCGAPVCWSKYTTIKLLICAKGAQCLSRFGLIQYFMFSYLLCISTSFLVQRTRKLVELLFSAVLNLFCSFKPFSVISRLKLTKNVWKWTKKHMFCLLLKAGWHPKAGRLPEGVPWNCLFTVDCLLFLIFFSSFRLFLVFILCLLTFLSEIDAFLFPFFNLQKGRFRQ